MFSLVTGVMLRGVFPENDPLMDQLWEVSSKRAVLMARLARHTAVAADRAYTVGLFQDCGAVSLANRVIDYRQTWLRTRWQPNGPVIERREHVTDHPTLSALLVQHWGLPDEIAQAVRFHHEIDKLEDLSLPARTRRLVALSVIANFVLVQAVSQDAPLWESALGQAATILDVPSMVVQAWSEQASALV